jgi:hypothetical protein
VSKIKPESESFTIPFYGDPLNSACGCVKTAVTAAVVTENVRVSRPTSTRSCHGQRAGSRTRGGGSRPIDGDLRHAGVTPARGQRGDDVAHRKRCLPAMPTLRRRGRLDGWR